MTAAELAAKLNGREYGSETTSDEVQAAKAAGLVIVYGASDDVVEFEGAIVDEVGAWEGVTIPLTSAGLFKACDDEDCTHTAAALKATRAIKAVWTDGHPTPPWTFGTDIPHATFEVVEDGEVFCRGIVFALADVTPPAAAAA